MSSGERVSRLGVNGPDVSGPGVGGPGVGAWLAPRLASVPPDVAREVPGWLEPARPLEPATPEALCREAGACLERAADAAGPHGGAFDLLAADAFATWACQAALEVDDPDAALARVVGSLVG